MSTKLRCLLLEKFTDRLNKNLMSRNVKNMQVTYRHNENNFLVKLPIQEATAAELTDDKYTFNKSEYIQLYVSRDDFIQSIIEGIISKDIQHDNKPKKVVLDFSSPNIAKPFHVGHLRSTIIGNFIANINKYYNNDVTRINYLGDWGTQFGLLQYGLKARKLNLDDIKEKPIEKLFEAYVYANKLAATDENVREEARRYFTNIEQGHEDLGNWKKIREVTVQELEKVYQRLGVQFDDYLWESDYNAKAIKGIMETLEKLNILHTDDEGKKVAMVNNKNVTVLKSDNSTLYMSRDIAGLLHRYIKYKFNEMLYIVDNAQTDHFTTLFEIVKQINSDLVNGCKHVKFGRIKGMSTRSGNVVFLGSILDEAKNKMYEQQKESKNTRTAALNDETCDILGTTAVVINDLKQKRLRDYTFDWDRALQSEGDSGIKLQYLHCRLWSLEQNCGIAIPETCEPRLISEQIIGDVVAELAKFETVLNRSYTEYEACVIVSYLFRLARHVNRMFNELKVRNVDADVAAQRLLVFHSARLVVKTGLEILGVKPLHEM
ncbi:probable arginine--tRNA ligase, mitochondrial isoform X1 [Cydia pomonella]|uniref:probable arginine--tRNA ligase, mitochondrial isoform X1 n=1 Tax=Cydia pomonella TaxID=82600 RepID=UPI002ADD38BB|nr:probable arginine--tRNA ligase, mitochondrial isoform X1 [Cydia pomonella]XP_061706509.1 probable arginine--tRNA ligase, mitochondrial isoform X1 [Cydia pomonella]